MPVSVLFSEPDAEVCVSCADVFRRMGYSIDSYCRPDESLQKAGGTSQNFYAAVVDVSPLQSREELKASRDIIAALHKRGPRVYVVSISTDPRKTVDSDLHIDKPYRAHVIADILDQRIHACFQETLVSIQHLWDKDFRHCITGAGNTHFRETMRSVRTAYNEGRYGDAGTKAREIADEAAAKSDYCERTGPEPAPGWSYFDMFHLWYKAEGLIWEKERVQARKSALPTRHEVLEMFSSGEGVALTGDDVVKRLTGVATGPVRMLLQTLVREGVLRKHQGSFLLNSPSN